MATGLEAQLIRGAGEAAESHQDIINKGWDKAVKGVTEAAVGVAKSVRKSKKRNLLKKKSKKI